MPIFLLRTNLHSYSCVLVENYVHYLGTNNSRTTEETSNVTRNDKNKSIFSHH